MTDNDKPSPILTSMYCINIHTIFLKTGIPISGTTLVYGHFQQIKGASNDLTPTIVNIDVKI